jgi:hypothetical protein
VTGETPQAKPRRLTARPAESHAWSGNHSTISIHNVKISTTSVISPIILELLITDSELQQPIVYQIRRSVFMFYRRKFYTLRSEFAEIFNNLFNTINLPNQLKHGSRLVGRWTKDNHDGTVEIFAIWEYDSYEDYLKIEEKVRSDAAHVKRINDWYEANGGKEFVQKEYFIEARNEAIESTVQLQERHI